MRSDTETTTILDTAEGQAMSRILGSDAFYDANPHSYAGLVQRLQMLREGGLPPMRVVSAAEIERLGRIPRSTDTDAKVEDALDVVQRCGQDAAGKPLATLTFFSHQWLRPNWCEAKKADLAWGSPERAQAAEEGLVVGDVDSADHEKAKALVQWAKWLAWTSSKDDGQAQVEVSVSTSNILVGIVASTVAETVYSAVATAAATKFVTNLSSSADLEVYFWIDYCSSLQNTREAPAQIVPYMAALPAYVAVCAAVAAYWTEAYDSRAWCQTEMLMGYAFVSTGDKLWIVPKGFEHGEQDGVNEEEMLVPDPANPETAKLTNEADRPVLVALTETARNSKAFGCWRTFVRQCTPGEDNELPWCMLINCCCCQCFGCCAVMNAREVKPGASVVTKLTPMMLAATAEASAAAPQAAVMERA